jgi:hypothetical protein
VSIRIDGSDQNRRKELALCESFQEREEEEKRREQWICGVGIYL